MLVDGAMELVIPRSFQLQHERARVPDRPRLSSIVGEAYAPTSDHIQSRISQSDYSRRGAAPFPGLADGFMPGGSDLSCLPTDMARGLHLGR